MASKDAKTPAQRASALLDDGATLTQRARTLAQLDTRLAAALPEKLRPYVSLANIRGDCAIIVAESEGWAAQTRALAPRIARYLRAKCGMKDIRNVRVIVRPLPLFALSPRRRRKHMSARSGQALQKLADRVNDANLGAALRRLARHAQPSSS